MTVLYSIMSSAGFLTMKFAADSQILYSVKE
jgi:hypothetical protein